LLEVKKIILKKISFFRFREQDAEDTWRQVALTISVMPVNERMIKKLNECAFMFQDKVSDLEIRDNLLEVCNKAKDSAKIFQKLTKEIDELEQVICGDKTLPIPATPKKSQRPREAGTAKKKKVSAKRNNAIWSSDEEEDSMPGTRIMKVPVSFYLKFSDTVSTESTVPSRSSRRLRS
jgi:hypothetical protein